MIKLLNANFYRLKKSMCFWILMIVMAFLGIYIYDNYNSLNCVGCDYNRLGEVIFVFAGFICILLPIFITLFIGTEYSDGGIRNKIIKGHTRTNIYLANLLTCIIVSIIYSIIYIIFSSIMGLIWGNHIAIPQDIFLVLILDVIMLNIFTSSLFTFITMSLSNKTSASIISFATVVWSLMISSNLSSKISQSTGIFKTIYQFFLNIIPYGQAYQIMDCANAMHEGASINIIDPTNQYQTLWLFSLCFIIIINFYGIMIINKKQLN